MGAGGLAMLLPNNWSMMGKFRKIPDTVEHFTGFYKDLDLIGGPFLGLVKSLNIYHPNGTAKVRNVKLPFDHGHFTISATAHLAENEAITDWINKYVPTNEPELTVEFSMSSKNIFWAADVWYNIKKQWCLEAQRLIRAKRSMKGAIGRRGAYVHTGGKARMKQPVP